MTTITACFATIPPPTTNTIYGCVKEAYYHQPTTTAQQQQSSIETTTFVLRLLLRSTTVVPIKFNTALLLLRNAIIKALRLQFLLLLCCVCDQSEDGDSVHQALDPIDAEKLLETVKPRARTQTEESANEHLSKYLSLPWTAPREVEEQVSIIACMHLCVYVNLFN